MQYLLSIDITHKEKGLQFLRTKLSNCSVTSLLFYINKNIGSNKEIYDFLSGFKCRNCDPHQSQVWVKSNQQLTEQCGKYLLARIGIVKYRWRTFYSIEHRESEESSSIAIYSCSSYNYSQVILQYFRPMILTFHCCHKTLVEYREYQQNLMKNIIYYDVC